MWVEVVRARWLDPFSTLRREWFELSQIKDLILADQLICRPLQRRKTQPLKGIITVTMPTELEKKSS